MTNNFIKWTKGIAKYYMWAFGLMLTHIAVIREIITLPDSQSQLQLLILLYIFDFVLVIRLVIDIYQRTAEDDKVESNPP